MQIVLGIIVLALGIALVVLGRMSNAGTGPVAVLVRNDVAAMFYIMASMVVIIAGVATLITPF